MNQIFEQYKTLLAELIAFKSISTDPAYTDEMVKTATWYTSLFSSHGFTVDVLKGETTNPVIVARYTIPTGADDTREFGVSKDNIVDETNSVKNPKTVLVYGHYDVQPADQPGWESDAFTLTERNNRLYGRGTVDNKGQLLIHIATVLDLIKHNTLKKNVVFLIEGNEETSNPELAGLLKKHKELLVSDIIMVSDGELSGDHPVIETSLRGGTNIKVTYKTAHMDVHSGIYGGSVANAAHELSAMLSTCFDYEKNTVAIPGFYDGCIPASEIEKLNPPHIEGKLIERGDSQLSHIGAKKKLCEFITDESQMNFHEQTGARPTMQVTGISSGYIGSGFANIVPHKAEARLNIRTVAPQQTADIVQAITNHIQAHTKPYIDVNIEYTEANDPFAFSCNTPIIDEVKKALFSAFGNEVIVARVGGSIPIVSDLKTELGGEVALVPLGNDDCNMHGANENSRIDLVLKGMAFSTLFFGADGN